MRYRRLDSAHDYVLGQSSQDFISDLDAVAQAIYTRLNLYKGAFWRDTSDGLPLFQNILGTSGSPQNRSAIDGIIQNRIAGTQGVQTITAFSSTWDATTRKYSFEATVQTVYSTTIITGTL